MTTYAAKHRDDAELALLRDLANVGIGAALAAGTNPARVRNAKGDAVRAFDLAAHAAMETLLRERQVPLVLLSEEARPQHMGRGAPLMRLVIDPVDGSDNFARGLPFAAMSNFCAAALPPAGPLAASTVRAALIHPLAGADATFVMDHEGARAEWPEGSMALRVNKVERLQKAMISVELNHHAPGLPLAEVMQTARGVRTLGCCSAALLAVARGQLDAHIDVRGRLTAESWLAAAAMVRAAGGVIMLLDAALEQAPPPANLLERRSIIAAASRDLLEDILARLRKVFL